MNIRLVLAAAFVTLLEPLVAIAAGPLSPPNEGRAEQIESLCTITAEEGGLTGTALEQSVHGCVADQSPNLAYWESCRQKARKRHLSGLALNDDVNFCMSQEP